MQLKRGRTTHGTGRGKALDELARGGICVDETIAWPFLVVVIIRPFLSKSFSNTSHRA